MHLEQANPEMMDEGKEPCIVCERCGSRETRSRIIEGICPCGVVTVLRDFALSAPQLPLRLFVTELSKVPFFHRDGRGLNPREACTQCTQCFVCKLAIDTQACAWEEVPLEGLLDKTGLTQHYVYLHPACHPAFEAWFDRYVGKLRQEESNRNQSAAHREQCIAEAICIECGKSLSLIDRFSGRVRHKACQPKIVRAALAKSSKISKTAPKKSVKKKKS